MKTRDLIDALSIMDPSGGMELEVWCPAMPTLRSGDAVLLKVRGVSEWRGVAAIDVSEPE